MPLSSDCPLANADAASGRGNRGTFSYLSASGGGGADGSAPPAILAAADAIAAGFNPFNPNGGRRSEMDIPVPSAIPRLSSVAAATMPDTNDAPSPAAAAAAPLPAEDKAGGAGGEEQPPATSEAGAGATSNNGGDAGADTAGSPKPSGTSDGGEGAPPPGPSAGAGAPDQPQKKRRQERQMRPEDLDDEHECADGSGEDDEDKEARLVPGTFQRASDEQLQKRRILKVRRPSAGGGGGGGAAAVGPSSAAGGLGSPHVSRRTDPVTSPSFAAALAIGRPGAFAGPGLASPPAQSFLPPTSTSGRAGGSAASRHLMEQTYQARDHQRSARELAFRRSMRASTAAMEAEREVANQMADNIEKEAKEDEADMAEYMAECRKMMAEKNRRRAENNRRLEETRKQVAKKAWEEREMEQHHAAEYVKAHVEYTVKELAEARADTDTINRYETGGPETVREAAALRREVDDLRGEVEEIRGELGDARTKIGALEAELARTRLEEKKEMEE